jgi:hypothetical protein
MLESEFNGSTFKAVKNTVIDVSADGGILAPCAGSTSPWCSHLGAEEAWSVGYYCGRSCEATDTEAKFRAQNLDFTSALGAFYIYKGGRQVSATLADFKAKISPYEYAWRFECKPNGGKNPACAKLYAAGRGDGEVGIYLRFEYLLFSYPKYMLIFTNLFFSVDEMCARQEDMRKTVIWRCSLPRRQRICLKVVCLPPSSPRRMRSMHPHDLELLAQENLPSNGSPFSTGTSKHLIFSLTSRLCSSATSLIMHNTMLPRSHDALLFLGLSTTAIPWMPMERSPGSQQSV